MVDADLMTFIYAALPSVPARVLEVGAGNGEVAAALSQSGYDVTAIDPAAEAPNVLPVALRQFHAPRESFDAALAVVSLHHVEPLAESCRRLAELVRCGGTLVVDEFDVDLFDERAASWWLSQRGITSDDEPAAEDVVADRRAHLHSLQLVRETLGEWFSLSEPVHRPYLYRWKLAPGARAAEERLIAARRLPATGARFIGFRR